MIYKKKIIFVTATRADFGKLKSLIKVSKSQSKFEVFIVVTGMHIIKNFGNTHLEINKFFKSNIYKFENQTLGDRLEIILTKTTEKFSQIVKEIQPDLIVLHGDRVETLACALVGSLNHILTAHVEGGELSGTIDDTIRHAVTKLSHIHFVGSTDAKKRVKKMGEIKNHIHNIGSPDIDVILNDKLPSFDQVKKRYSIKFDEYAILAWHPVTSKVRYLKNETTKLLKFLQKIKRKIIIIYPNNDPGNKLILDCYRKLKNNKFKIVKSLRFEYFLTLLKNSQFIIGNSSSAIYEAPILKVPAINIGDRQHKRIKSNVIKNFEIHDLSEKKLNSFLKSYKATKKVYFGYGNSDKKFLKIISKKSFWNTPTQKFFSDFS
jgi:UDP-N-acetylglucosamine 2-epimerase (hydrolysing)